MKRFQRIVVGVELSLDGTEVSEASRHAAEQARWMASRGAGLTFLHSTWVDIHEDSESESVLQGPSDEGRRALAEFAAGAGAELVVVEERPWLGMIRLAASGEADLLMVGRNEAPGSHAFGSTARKLLRKCPVPVWVTRLEADVELETILAATDLTPVGDEAVEIASELARERDADLHVVHAWQRSMELQLAEGIDDEVREREEALQAAAEGRVRAGLERVAADLEVGVHVACDSPSHLILRGVEELSADLVVMGTLSRTGIAGLLMGNTAERLLPRVHCSILAIKPTDFRSPVAG